MDHRNQTVSIVIIASVCLVLYAIARWGSRR